MKVHYLLIATLVFIKIDLHNDMSLSAKVLRVDRNEHFRN